MLLLWAATLWRVQHSITANFERMADEEFAGARRSVDALQAERLKQMRQACSLVMNIPELRALIAEVSSEISAANVESLNERLDGLSAMVGVDLVCVLDDNGALIAQNRNSPWTTLEQLQRFFSQSPQATAMVRETLDPRPDSDATAIGAQGLWVDRGHLFQVVAMPLIFDDGSEGAAPSRDGALIMAGTITDQLTRELGKGHNCQITFLADGRVLASTLATPVRQQLEHGGIPNLAIHGQAFEIDLGLTPYRSWLEPLKDPSSKQPVGEILVQMSHEELQSTQRRMSRLMLGILGTGLLAAALASYLLSGAMTRPIGELVQGVRRVADGDLELSLSVKRRDELGTLAGAFNDMVSQLRTRHELQRLVEESQAASRAKSQFLANMSHEIRTPLNGVVGLTQLLLTTTLDERQRRYTELVQSSARVLTTLINDVLDFSKIEAGKLELESIPFSPVAVVEEVLELLAPKAHAKNIELIGDAGTDIPTLVRGDPNRTRQILLNLLSNAVKFTDRGHVILRARCDCTPSDSTTIRFEVTDTGIGIPKERQGQLFQSFSQVDASTTRKHGGTGLGLAISKQLAELMCGTIGVESESGRGSTFWFTANFLPEDASPGAMREPPPHSIRSAIVAESNMQAADVARHRLTDLGITATIAHDANELINRIREIERDSLGAESHVVLVSEELIASRQEQWRAFIAQPAASHPKLVLIAKSDLNLDAGSLCHQGISGYILKPVTSSKLTALLWTLTQRPGQRQSPMGQSVQAQSLDSIRATRGAHILLAEDNQVNQIVVVDMLANAGYRCEVVSDGAAAVNSVSKGAAYDLILMDCQMPNMDGFEATRRIRQQELARGAKRHVPIIALTASAISGDKQKCLDAGMDGYCTKPIAANALISMIESYLNQRSTHAHEAESVPQEIAEQSPALIDYEALLHRCGGKVELVKQVLSVFAANMTECSGSITASLQRQDSVSAAKLAHSLKGAAGMAGASALHQAAADLESRCRANQLDSIEQCLDKCREEIDRCLKFVEDVVGQESNHAPPTRSSME